MREADHYLAEVGGRFATGAGSEETLNDLQREVALWEDAPAGDCLTGDLSAVDLTVYPVMALLLRVAAAERISTRKTPSGRVSPPGSIACRRFPSFNRHLAAALEMSRSGLTSAGAPRWRTERTVREAVVRNGDIE